MAAVKLGWGAVWYGGVGSCVGGVQFRPIASGSGRVRRAKANQNLGCFHGQVHPVQGESLQFRPKVSSSERGRAVQVDGFLIRSITIWLLVRRRVHGPSLRLGIAA